MNNIISCRNVSKHYKNKRGIHKLNFDVKSGEIIGLIGPNGAGKTTLMKVLLGLAQAQGSIEVLGMSPVQQRTEILNQVSFIADTAILPKWITAEQSIAFVAGTHPKFDINKARLMLEKTDVPFDAKVSQLSKGMITQLHLILIMAIDSKLLILDEPTLGLDILYRKSFYQQLLNDYFDQDKTIIITTHQVEEIEHILTRVVFLARGEIVLDEQIERLQQRFSEATVPHDQAAAIDNAIQRSKGLAGTTLLFDHSVCEPPRSLPTTTPRLSDIFVATVTPNAEGTKA